MKKVFLIITLGLFSCGVFAQTTWKSDKGHSQLKFDITHLGVSTVSGGFSDFEATVTTGTTDFSDASFELTAKTASVNTGIERRDNHLKSADFFDATANPTMTFKSNSIKKAGKNKYRLAGDLTMHGISKPITMELWYRGTVTNPMSKKEVTGFRATGNINRADFGIGPKFPAVSISETVTIIADGEFGKQ